MNAPTVRGAPPISLRDYQGAAIEALLAHWRAQGGNALIEMATGLGKSVVIAALIHRLLAEYPGLRILVLVHVKELVDQNVRALLRLWPSAPVGVNSAGLGRRDRDSQILFASIQSIYRQKVADIARGRGRRSWLVFCAGIDHAKHVRDALRRRGVVAETVSSRTSNEERDRLIAEFRAGRLQALTNANMLTTGFDAAGVDTIALLRPTLSAGLFVQMLGRGTRPIYADGHDLTTAEGRRAAIAASSKPHCLVLDFAGNVRTHGPVDLIDGDLPGMLRRQPGARVGEVRAKDCPNCQTMVGLRATICDQCGYRWPDPKPKHKAYADDINVMGGKPASRWVTVMATKFQRHMKPGSPDSLRVNYHCADGNIVSEWLAFERRGFPAEKAVRAWRAMGGNYPAPRSITDALRRIHELTCPAEIRIRKVEKFTEVMDRRTAKILQATSRA